MALAIDPGDRSTILIHYYRAMVGRADIWRTRLDATTNWAIGATAAVLSLTLGNSAVPHFVVFVAPLLTLSFLLLEARRLTFYHLWQQRVLMLERALIGPALRASAGMEETPAGPEEPSHEDLASLAELDSVAAIPDAVLPEALERHMGRTVPTMPIAKAVARRLRRVYLYLFGVQILAWLLELATNPGPARGAAELLTRAHVGPVPGPAVVLAVALALLGLSLLAWVRGGVDRDPA